MSRRFGQELFEVLKQIWSITKQLRDLSVDVLDGLGFPLVCLENLQELFINLRLPRVALLVDG